MAASLRPLPGIDAAGRGRGRVSLSAAWKCVLCLFGVGRPARPILRRDTLIRLNNNTVRMSASQVGRAVADRDRDRTAPSIAFSLFRLPLP